MPHNVIGLWGWGEVLVVPWGFIKEWRQVCPQIAMHHLKIPEQRHSGEHMKFRLVIVWCLILCIYKIIWCCRSALKLYGPRKRGSEIYLHTPVSLIQCIHRSYHLVCLAYTWKKQRPPDYIGPYGPNCLSIFLFSTKHWIKLNSGSCFGGPDNSNDSATSNYLVNTQNWTPLFCCLLWNLQVMHRPVTHLSPFFHEGTKGTSPTPTDQ